MHETSLAVLEQNLEALESSVSWLQRSYEKCVHIGIKGSYTPDEFDNFENLTSRYARTTDILINKALCSLDLAEFQEPGTIIDSANRAVIRGLVDSVERLRELKDLRNEISHEYETEELTELFGLVLEASPGVCSLAKALKDYCEKKVFPQP